MGLMVAHLSLALRLSPLEVDRLWQEDPRMIATCIQLLEDRAREIDAEAAKMKAKARR